MGYGPIKHFTDIEAWKLARKLRVAVYNGVKKLPREEKYELAAPVKWSLRSQLNGLEGFNGVNKKAPRYDLPDLPR